MIWLGDTIILLMSVVALSIGLKIFFTRTSALYFIIILGSLACHIMGYAFDLCELLTLGKVSDGINIGYLGNIGCFLFLLTANYGCMDGILDDKTAAMKKSRYIALLAPLAVALIYFPNLFLTIPTSTKLAYIPVFLIAMATSYMNLKHAIIPDLGFMFVKAIRPFNICAVIFTLLELIHLTLWNLENWFLLMISGILLGTSTIVLIITVDRGIKKWTI